MQAAVMQQHPLARSFLATIAVADMLQEIPAVVQAVTIVIVAMIRTMMKHGVLISAAIIPNRTIADMWRALNVRMPGRPATTALAVIPREALAIIPNIQTAATLLRLKVLPAIIPILLIVDI